MYDVMREEVVKKFNQSDTFKDGNTEAYLFSFP